MGLDDSGHDVETPMEEGNIWEAKHLAQRSRHFAAASMGPGFWLALPILGHTGCLTCRSARDLCIRFSRTRSSPAYQWLSIFPVKQI